MEEKRILYVSSEVVPYLAENEVSLMSYDVPKMVNDQFIFGSLAGAEPEGKRNDGKFHQPQRKLTMQILWIRSKSKQGCAYESYKANYQEVFSVNFHVINMIQNKDHKKYAKQGSNESCRHQEH